MVKKTLLSLAIAATAAGLAGCNVSTTDKYDNDVDSTPVESGKPLTGPGGTEVNLTRAIYDPSGRNAAGLPNIPLITDLLLQGLAGTDVDCATAGDPATCLDGTIPFPGGDIPFGLGNGYNPIFSAVGDLDGFSTTSAIDVPFGGPLNKTSLVTDLGPNTNVLLIPLVYTNDPVSGGKPANDEAPTLAANPFGAPANITASVVSYTDIEGATAGGAPVVLRIMPNEPLKPATRYLVVITDGVKDAYGNGVKSSGTFSLLANVESAPADKTTATLQGAIKNWVNLAKGFMKGALGRDLTTDNIAYATTFTTGGGAQVLTGMAAPSVVNPLVNQALPASIRYQIEKELVANDGNIQLATAAVAGYITGLAGSSDPVEQAKGAGLINVLGGAEALATNLGAAVTLAKHLPQAAPRVAEFDKTGVPLSAFTAITTPTGLKISNGSIKLPYYLSKPNLQENPLNAVKVIANFWNADNTLAGDLSALLAAANVSGSAVTPPSTNVTRYFPLAKTGDHTGDDGMGLVDVPISVFYSATADCSSTGYSPVIYQHGITTKRTAAIPFAAQTAAANPCTATIAIDLPLHGLVPTTALEQQLLGGLYTHPTDPGPENNVAFGTSVQRHFGLTANATGTPMSIGDAGAAAQSGSLFINILNFQTTRDNIRQAVMDQLNLNASVKFLDFDGSPGVDINQTAPVKFVGHSLGAIVGTNVVALANTLGGEDGANIYINPVESAVLANGSGHLTKMIENSPAFGPKVIGGFAALGAQATPNALDLSQGSSLFELTMHIFQATLDSADPINFAPVLKASAANSGVLMFEVAGRADCADATCQPDNAVPPAAFAANGLAPTVSDAKYADTAAAPLVGSTPLAAVAGLTAASASTGDGSTHLRHIVRFTEGTHSSFGAIDDAAGTEMVTQALSFLGADGKSLTMSNTSVVKAAE